MKSTKGKKGKKILKAVITMTLLVLIFAVPSSFAGLTLTPVNQDPEYSFQRETDQWERPLDQTSYGGGRRPGLPMEDSMAFIMGATESPLSPSA